jgi:hypothetical protein
VYDVFNKAFSLLWFSSITGRLFFFQEKKTTTNKQVDSCWIRSTLYTNHRHLNVGDWWGCVSDTRFYHDPTHSTVRYRVMLEDGTPRDESRDTSACDTNQEWQVMREQDIKWSTKRNISSDNKMSIMSIYLYFFLIGKWVSEWVSECVCVRVRVCVCLSVCLSGFSLVLNLTYHGVLSIHQKFWKCVSSYIIYIKW